MTPENFCYWLQGYFELLDTDKNKKVAGESLSIEQVKMIKDHLGYVFKKTTPSPTKSDISGMLGQIDFSKWPDPTLLKC